MTVLRAIIWKRSDYRETSRLVTLLTRERGKLNALAKGAHRQSSPMLGHLDFLNLVEARLAGRGLPILSQVRLLHEPRGLRQTRRFLACNYLAEIFDRACLEGRQDVELFDLVEGALLLIERCPLASLPHVLAGIELRFLAILGQRAMLDRCSICEQKQGDLYLAKEHGGLYCADHRPARAKIASQGARKWLEQLDHSPGKTWPGLSPSEHNRRALDILGIWLESGVEYMPRSRARLLRMIC